MNKFHEVIVDTDSTALHLTVDGQAYHLRWDECSPRLAKATAAQRGHLEVSPSGYGIHWPEIDEDLAIAPLIRQASGVE
ncbi:MAG: DUF2442 domain-containing protein [Anaerolineales bacterium]|nr:DUF2442 domain-containing protein [Anaerolineales bacterium]